MRGSRGIRAADVQRLLSMVIDICTGSASPLHRKQTLIAGLAQVFDARVGEIVEISEGPRPGTRRFVSFVDYGWDSIQQGSKHVQRSLELNLTDPMSEYTMGRPDVAMSVRREDSVADSVWYECAYVNEVLRPADLDSVLGCYRRFRIDPVPAHMPGLHRRVAPVPCPCGSDGVLEPLTSGIVGIGVGLHRAWTDSPFTQRDVALLAHFNNAMTRLYPYVLFNEDEQVWRDLPRRMQEMLELLLQGLGDRTIAARMHLSPHTIHDYAAELYKRFKVDGRTALMAKILGRPSH